MAVARAAARRRSTGGWSAGTATTMLLCIACLSLVSRKSLTSRPRSPIRPVTTISASAPAIIWPISTDLPTPEPAMMAMRWPRPAVSSALTARTPRSNGSVTRPRSRTLPFTPLSGQTPPAMIGPLRSSGWPMASMTRPISPSPTCTILAWLSGSTRMPFSSGASASSGTNKVRSPRKPTTSARQTDPSLARTRAPEPIGRRKPVTSSMPASWLTRRPTWRGWRFWT